MSRPPDFDRLARLYCWMEWFSFGPWLMRCRCAFLSELPGSRRALVLGDGDGRFTARLLDADPTVRIDAIDASAAMLKTLARRARPHARRLRIQAADARDWQPEGQPADSAWSLPYDLIVTHFFLDCLTTEEVRALASTLRAALAPPARWVLSEFAVPEGWFGWLVARPVVWGLYCAFGWLTGLELRRLPDHAWALGQAGFSLEARRCWLAGLLVSELWRTTPADSAPGQGEPPL
jgi:SAM-dependent methyltransferase